MSETEKGILLQAGWSVGNHCRMLTNKRKGCTAEYTITGYDGRYFLLRSNTGSLHRASPQRLFRTREEALRSLVREGG